MASIPPDCPSNVHRLLLSECVCPRSLRGTMLDSCRLAENASNRAMAATLPIQSIVVILPCHICDILNVLYGLCLCKYRFGFVLL